MSESTKLRLFTVLTMIFRLCNPTLQDPFTTNLSVLIETSSRETSDDDNGDSCINIDSFHLRPGDHVEDEDE